MLKFARFEITSAVLVSKDMSRTAQRKITAHRAVFDYEPRPGYLYVRSRAISSRCNDNFDEFPAEEIKKAYATFIGKPVFVNHHNNNHRRMRGVIIDAALHEDTNPDGTPDTWAEVLMEVDAVKFPILAKAILAGEVDRTSMGTDVAYSECSACGNRASSPAEYCAHIPRMKGKRIYQVTGSTGAKEGVLVREKCFGLKFFENSLLVEDPADPTAFFLGVDDRGMKMHAGLVQAIENEGPTTDAEAMKMGLQDDVTEAREDLGLPPLGAALDPAEPKGDQSGRLDGVTLAQDDKGYYVRTHRARSDSYPSPADIPDSKVEFIRSTGALRDQAECPHDGEWNLHGQCKQCGFTPHTEADDECDDDYCQSKGFPDGWHTKGEHITPAHLDPNSDASRDAEKSMRDAFGGDEDHSWLLDHQHQGPTHLSALSYEAFATQASLPPYLSAKSGLPSYLAAKPKKRPVPMSQHYVGLTQQWGGIHAVHPDDYDMAGDTDGWAKARCGANVSVDHRGNAPLSYADSYDESPTCLRCAKASGTDEPESDSGMSTEASMPSYLAAKTKPVGQMTPEELDSHRSRQAEGKAWNAKNPPRIKHVVSHWDQATDDEKANGENWYSDAHHLAKHISNDTKTPMHVMAGLMTNYSPQTHWAANIHTAARVARTKTALGGKGDGVMASSRQKEAASKMLDGTHYEDVFKGKAPKIRAFGHLIEHGGNADPKDQKVVIDRHALSVACGSRATDMAYEQSGLGSQKKYDEVSHVYRKAAKAISKKEGREIEPHQVQAATWLVRQRLNETHDRQLSATAGSRSTTLARRAVGEWNKYAAEHHPAAMGKEPGTGYSQSTPDDVQHAHQMHEEDQTMSKASGWTPTEEDLLDFTDHMRAVAFGETKAPADVDTLRDEECPVCGETDSYDGNSCQVCGFDAPPQMFQDPNLDMAKALDLRQDLDNDAGSLPGAVGDGMTPGEQDANAGVPGAIPGETVPGSDATGVPVDPSMVDADGNVTPTTDPAQIAQQQMELLQSGQPITPDMLGPTGEPIAAGADPGLDPTLDPEAATGHFDQGGEPFTPGPNAPGEPGEPEGPVSPDDLDENGEPGDGQPEDVRPAEGDPGTPEDGVADLQCPACGFQADAAQPQSVDMDSQALPDAGAGTMAGDVCPNCQQAQLLSVGEMEQMAGAPPRV